MASKFGGIALDEETPKATSVGSKFGGTPVEEEEPTPAKGVLSHITDVINRGIIAKGIGGFVDMASTGLEEASKIERSAMGKDLQQKMGAGYKAPEKPVLGSEWIGQKMQEAGMVTPTRRPAEEEAASMLPIAITGGVSGAKAAKKAFDFYKLSKGTEAEQMAQSLRGELESKAGEVVSQQEAAQQPELEKLQKIGKAQEELGGREKVASAREKQRQATLEKHLTSLSSENKVLAEDVGEVIQPAGRKNIQALKQTQQEEAIGQIKDPAFAEAKARQAKGDFISTNPKSAEQFNKTLGEVKQQIEDTPEPFRSELKKRFSAIEGEKIPLTEEEKKVEQLRATVNPGYKPKDFKTKPLTLDQAEFLRRMLTNKDLTTVEGFSALDATRMKKLSDKLLGAMNAYEPRVGEYIQKYKETSEPITRALAGRGKALTDTEIAAEEKALFSADKKATANYYLDGSQEKAERLLALTGGKDPKVLNAIRGHFRTEVEGMTAKQTEDFIRKQEGLLRVFPEMRTPLMKIAESKKINEMAGTTAGKKAEAAATRLAGEAERAKSAITMSEKEAEKYRMSLGKLSTGDAKQAMSEGKSIINNLRKDKKIDDVEYKKLLNQFDEIERKYGKSAAAKNAINYMVRRSIYGMGVAGTAGYYGYKALSED